MNGCGIASGISSSSGRGWQVHMASDQGTRRLCDLEPRSPRRRPGIHEAGYHGRCRKRWAMGLHGARRNRGPSPPGIQNQTAELRRLRPATTLSTCSADLTQQHGHVIDNRIDGSQRHPRDGADHPPRPSTPRPHNDHGAGPAEIRRPTRASRGSRIRGSAAGRTRCRQRVVSLLDPRVADLRTLTATTRDHCGRLEPARLRGVP